MNDNQHIPSGYKPSPLGIIPEDWEVKRVKDVSTIKGRIGYRGYTIDDIVNDENGAISLSPSNIVDGKLQFNSVTCITWEKYYESPEIMLCNGDIVMVKTGSSFGKVAFVDNLPQEATINPQFVIINNIKCDNKWLCYLFDSDCIQKNVHQIVVGGAIPTMSQEEIANFKIAIPPLPEQHRIVSVLSLWDTAIEKQTALIDKLTLRKRGLMQQLLTGKKRLKGFYEQWKTIELGDALSYIQPTKYLVVSENYHNTYNTPVLTAGKTFILGYTDETTGIFNDLPAIIFDDFTTESKYVTFPFKAKSSAMKILKAHNSNLYFMFCAMQMIKYSIGGHERHWISKFSHLTLKVPSLEEQNAIASVLVQADKEIEIQKQKLAAMQEQKKGLMQVLLTGKKRIMNL